jgi:hypothetical protein
MYSKTHSFAALGLFLLGSHLAQAATFTLTPSQVSGGAGQTASPNLELSIAGDGTTIAAQTSYTYDSAKFAATVQNVGEGMCSAPSSGLINVLIFPFSFEPLPTTPQVICRITLTIKPAASPGDYDLTLKTSDTLCSDELGDPVTPCVGALGTDAIRVLETPIAYSPTHDADGISDNTVELTLPPAPFGAKTTAAIQITPGSSAANLVCNASAPFTLIGGNNQFIGMGQNNTPIGVECQSLGDELAGTLSCSESDINGGPARLRLWDLTCSAPTGTGSEIEVPELTNAAVMFTGAQGHNSTGLMSIHNLGNASLELSACHTQHSEVTLASNHSILPTSIKEISMDCALPMSLTPLSGQVECDTNDIDEPKAYWNYQCISVIDVMFSDNLESELAP